MLQSVDKALRKPNRSTIKNNLLPFDEIKVANNATLSQAVEQRARVWYKSAMDANGNRKLNLPEFNYALNMLVRTPK